MHIYETRRKNLRSIVTERFHGKIVELADALGRAHSYLSRCLSANQAHRKNIGEQFARDIEARLGLSPLALDLQPVEAEGWTAAPSSRSYPARKHVPDHAGRQTGSRELIGRGKITGCSDRADECRRLKAIYNSKRISLGLTQQKLATMLGINQSSVSHYLNGINPLNAGIAVAFAKILGVDVSDFSERLDSDISRMAEASGNFGQVGPTGLTCKAPLIHIGQVLAWIADKASSRHPAPEIYAPCPIPLSQRAFAFTMPNTSMSGAQAEPVIRRGWTVFVEPESTALANQVVLATLEGREPIVGTYVTHGGREYVIPSNSIFGREEILPSDTCWYVGRVVFVSFQM